MSTAALALFIALLAGQRADAAPSSAATSPASSAPTESVLQVSTISYLDLMDASEFAASTADDVLQRAMLTDGIISISGIPGFAALRRSVMLGAARCGADAPAARTTVFADGTARRTFATVTKGFDAAGDAFDFVGAHKDAAAAVPASCSDAAFLASTDEFRHTVSTASEAFAKRLSEVFPTKDG